VYIDAGFFDELSNRFGASDDFAEAYVVSREVGHHVQNQLGIVPKFNEARQRMCGANAKKMSIRVELQADCFAGIWGKYTQQNVILDAGVVPDILDHGTSAQRVKWFKQGFDSGQLSSCSTFSGHV
jgi:predicted metalloprotease